MQPLPSPYLQLPAEALWTPWRFDLGAKVPVARSLLTGRGLTFAADVYREHLDAWNGCREEMPLKVGIDAYWQSFRRTFRSLRRWGFRRELSTIPVRQIEGKWTPVNGAHRLAAAIGFGKTVSCHRDMLSQPHDYDYSFFQRNDPRSRRPIALWAADAMALARMRELATSAVIIYFLRAESEVREVSDAIAHTTIPYFHRDFEVPVSAQENFIRYLYQGEKWLDEKEADRELIASFRG